MAGRNSQVNVGHCAVSAFLARRPRAATPPGAWIAGLRWRPPACLGYGRKRKSARKEVLVTLFYVARPLAKTERVGRM